MFDDSISNALFIRDETIIYQFATYSWISRRMHYVFLNADVRKHKSLMTVMNISDIHGRID